MRYPSLFAGLGAAAMTVATAAVAQPAAVGYAPVADLIKAFATPDGLGWDQLDARRGVRWIAPGPVMLKTPAPDGSSFARPGVVALAGRSLSIAASGARAGVGSVFIADTAPAVPAETVANDLRQAGLSLTPARCARDPARADGLRGWWRVTVGRTAAHLYVGPLASGRQGYTLYLADLPPMTQAEAANFVDCAGGKPAAGAPGAPQTGQAGVVAVIEAVMRPAGAPAYLPWAAPLPAVTWASKAPLKLSRGEYGAGGADSNPQTLGGRFKTPTTEMTVTATGDARGANRFYLEDGANLPREAVFSALRRDGYAIAAVTCGKPYTRMSENWFRISAPGKQPAILYRVMSMSTGRPTEGYAVRLDNTPPAIQPGQRPANGGSCPG